MAAFGIIIFMALGAVLCLIAQKVLKRFKKKSKPKDDEEE